MTQMSNPRGPPYNAQVTGKCISVSVTGEAIIADTNILNEDLTAEAGPEIYVRVYFVADTAGSLYLVRDTDAVDPARESLKAIAANAICTGSFVISPGESVNLRYTASCNITKMVIEDTHILMKEWVPPLVEIVTNGGFENGSFTATWTALTEGDATAEVIADAKHSGSYGAHLSASNDGSVSLYQYMFMSPGDHLSFWYRIVSATASSEFMVKGFGPIAIPSEIFVDLYPPTAGDWVHFEADITKEHATLNFDISTYESGSIEVYIDDISIIGPAMIPR